MAKKTNRRLRSLEGVAAEMAELKKEAEKPKPATEAATEAAADAEAIASNHVAEEAAEAAKAAAKAAAATVAAAAEAVEAARVADDAAKAAAEQAAADTASEDAAKATEKLAADKAAEDASLAEAAAVAEAEVLAEAKRKKAASRKKKVAEPVAAIPEVHVSVAAWRYFRPKLKASGRYFAAGVSAGAKGFWKDSMWIYRKFWKARPVAAVSANEAQLDAMTDEELQAEFDALVDAEIVRRQLEDNLRADMAAAVAEDVRASAPRVRRTGPRRPGDRIQLDTVEDIDQAIEDIEKSMMPAETPVVEKKLTMRERFTGRAKVS